MKKIPQSKTLSLALGLALSVFGVSSQAFSGPGTVTLSGGKTELALAPQFFNLFPSFGDNLDKYGEASKKGNLNRQNIRITFPLSSATLNPDRPDQAIGFYDFQHEGGMLMDRPSIGLSAIINTPSVHASNTCFASAQCLEMGAVLIVNGTVLDVVPNFAQSTSLPSSFQIERGNRVNLNNIQMFLTQRGANLMNAFFGLQQDGALYLQAGNQFGTLNISGRGANIICPPGRTYDNRYQQCLTPPR